MDDLEDLDDDLQVVVVGTEFGAQHRVLEGLFDQVHTAAVGLDVMQHFGVGDDVVDAIPVFL